MKEETITCDKCGRPAELTTTNDDRRAWVCHHCQHFLGYQPEIYSRVVGYLRPTSQWNPGKQQEFKDRVPYTLPKNIGEEKT